MDIGCPFCIVIASMFLRKHPEFKVENKVDRDLYPDQRSAVDIATTATKAYLSLPSNPLCHYPSPKRIGEVGPTPTKLKKEAGDNRICVVSMYHGTAYGYANDLVAGPRCWVTKSE
jgi:hypothetical protein